MRSCAGWYSEHAFCFIDKLSRKRLNLSINNLTAEKKALYSLTVRTEKRKRFQHAGRFYGDSTQSISEKLIDRQWNGQIKVITGIRRCGKSYLLRNLFKEYLLSRGVRDEQIIHFELDLISNIRYRNPLELSQYVHDRLDGKTEKFYLFIDEIQMSEPVKNPYLPNGKKITFYDALNDFKAIPNLDVYVTGSNSKMLSTDILTEFRGRGDEVRIHPLTFAEFYSATGGDKQEAMKQYSWYGGMPLVLQQKDNGEKSAYLSSLFQKSI